MNANRLGPLLLLRNLTNATFLTKLKIIVGLIIRYVSLNVIEKIINPGRMEHLSLQCNLQ
jgi:hypothetical protein